VWCGVGVCGVVRCGAVRRDIAPPEADMDYVKWMPFTSPYVPKYNKALSEAGGGTRRSWKPHNLTNWLSAPGNAGGLSAGSPGPRLCSHCQMQENKAKCPHDFDARLHEQCTATSRPTIGTHEMRCTTTAMAMETNKKVCHVDKLPMDATTKATLDASQRREICTYETLVCFVPGSKRGWQKPGSMDAAKAQIRDSMLRRIKCTVGGSC
jgi:hypothetical protein